MKIRTGNKQSHEARCYASGGRVPEDISDPGSLPKMAKPKMADGGMIDGGKAKPRLDRAGKKPSTTINITIGKGDQMTGAPGAGPLPMPPVPPMAGPPPAPPMAPPMPPMGAGGPPMMRKHGGRVMKHSDEAEDKKLIKKEVKASALKHKSAGGPVAEGQDMGTKKEAEDRLISRKDGGRGMKKADGGTVGSDDATNKYRGLSDKQLLDRASTYSSNFDRILAGKVTSNQTQGGTKYQEKANGGRVNLDAGAGSGLGRLEKIGKK